MAGRQDTQGLTPTLGGTPSARGVAMHVSGLILTLHSGGGYLRAEMYFCPIFTRFLPEFCPSFARVLPECFVKLSCAFVFVLSAVTCSAVGTCNDFFRLFWGGVFPFLGVACFFRMRYVLLRWSSGVGSRGCDDHVHMELLVIFGPAILDGRCWLTMSRINMPRWRQ